jgi:hypothetical protein
MLALALTFFLALPLFPDEIPALVQKAANLYNSERKLIQNYRVVQNITSELKNSTSVTIEKRNQVGFFISPNQFVFVIKEKTINGKQIPITGKNTEKSQKNDLNWLSDSTISMYQFEELGKNGNISKFFVKPKAYFPDSYEGELWIHEKTHKIIRIIKEPTVKPKGTIKYRTEIFFETNLPYQEPSYTKLNAILETPDGQKMEARVEAIFTNYLFNFDPKEWKE